MTKQERKRVDEQLREMGQEPGQVECPACCAQYGPSESYPWHWPLEDCRAIKEPVQAKQ